MADLKFGHLLGQGTFGTVFRGKWKSRGLDVALKKVNCTPDASNAQIMMELVRHPNIMARVHACLLWKATHPTYCTFFIALVIDTVALL